ncbi:MAG: hypothetical protein HYY45_13425 [Deltaproteobacteria bacterium]|nr:hypothetical protein [Deltaproteobacteria bacterium]
MRIPSSNGWLDSPNNSVGNLSILSGQLTAVGVGANVAGIYRPFSFATPVSVSATVAESSGYGGLPRSYTAIFEIRSNGAWTSGYWLDFVRSDSNYNDSLIQLGDGANVIARFYPSIQFGPVLNLNFTFNVDGSVVGTVAQNGQTESFSFSPHAIQSTGDHFLVALSGPDGRATTNPIYHRLDDLTIRGTCSPSAPPVANAGPDQAVAEGSVATLDGSASTGANLTFGWVQLAGPSVVLNNPSSPAPTFTAPLLPGGFGSQTLTFQLTVTSGSQTSSDTVDVKVVNVNHAPVAQAGADQVVREGSQVTLSGINSFDPDGDPILYQWIQTFGTPAALSGAGSPQATFTAPLIPGGVSGTEILRFALTVSDGALSHTDEVQVTVEQENHTPVANAGDGQTVRPGVVVTLNGSGSFDPDNDPITYQWTQVGGPAVVLSNPTTATPSLTTPAVASTTQLTFRLTVSDSLLISNPADVVVTVINGPPLCGLAQATPGLLWPPNHGMREVSISGVTDPDNDGVAVAITSVTQDEPVNGLGDGDTSPDAVIMGNKVLLRAERSGKGNGRVYQVSFSANDAEGGVCTGSVKVGVPQSMKPGMSAVDDGQLHDSTLP